VGKQKVTKEMARLGAARMLWMPLRVWPVEAKVEKIVRMASEGEAILRMEANLNEKGKHGTATPAGLSRYGEYLVIGKRKRTRQLIKFRRNVTAHKYTMQGEGTVARRVPPAIGGFDPIETKKEEAKRTLERWNKLFPLMIRLQRRPLKKQHNFGAMRSVISLRGLEAKELGAIVELAQTTLDATGRSIFMKNFRMIMAGQSKVVTLGVNIRSPALQIKGFEKQVLQDLQRWTRQWKRAGVLVLLTVRLVAAASQSVISALDSTPSWSAKARDEAV
jgi:hypothetical protein